MEVTSAAGSNVGLVRSGNEDSFLCRHPLYVVADGLGGHAAGEVASKMLVDQLADLDLAVDEADAEAAGQRLADGIRQANTHIREAAEAEPERAGMGTTATAAVAVGDRLCFAHVGDSRAYLVRDGTLRRVTEDHTPVQRAVRDGVLTPEDALRHPSRHVLAQAVGLDEDVDVDTPVIELASGDRVIVCSDGLTDPVPDDRMQQIIKEFASPQEAVDGLITAALHGGGPDNVTIVVIDVT